jgi:molybdopterin-guanine dinucleotide biosynthesis protein A
LNPIVSLTDSIPLPSFAELLTLGFIVSKIRNRRRPPAAAPLVGLVLAGGKSRRMGVDKGRLMLNGETLAHRAYELVAAVCGSAFVSVNESQTAETPYRDLPLIVDEAADRGPAGGLLAAWRSQPGAAWLVVAVDMPRVDRTLLDQLAESRNPAAVATAFRGPGGLVEPLCTIWEPAARALVQAEIEKGTGSLRRVLEKAGASILTLGEQYKLESLNTRRQLDALSGTSGSSLPLGSPES